METMNAGIRSTRCAFAMLLLTVALASFARAEDGPSPKEKLDKGADSLSDPKKRKPIGADEWGYDENGKLVIKVKGYTVGDMVWIYKDGLEIAYWEYDGVTYMSVYAAGKKDLLVSGRTDDLDKTGNKKYENEKDMFKKMLEKGKREMKKNEKKEKVSNDGPSPVTISVGIGFGFGGGSDCGHRGNCHPSRCHGRR